ncbi:uncharacterized protein [Triticum aestivum]|nr:uncharacterized protein LOC123155873 [Triticum aestivum]
MILMQVSSCAYRFRKKSPKGQDDRAIQVKHFKSIPMADMELVLPKKKNLSLTLMDWVRFIVSVVIGLIKEVIIAYYILMENGKVTVEDLDLQCEELIQEEFGLQCNFEDSIRRIVCVPLKRSGSGVSPEGVMPAVVQIN